MTIEKTVYKADAGPDVTVRVGEYVEFDGSRSELWEAKEFFYKWEADENNPCDVSVVSLPVPETVCGFLHEGEYTFYLTVSDFSKDSLPDTVVVTVLPNDNPVFEDKNLELSVRKSINLPSGRITENALSTLVTLRCFRMSDPHKISSIQNIGLCKNLEVIHFPFQNIADLSPLSECKKLKELHLDQNYVLEDIAPLSTLTELEILQLYINNIADITPLKNLKKLRVLGIFENPIHDISPIANCVELEELLFGHCDVSNISSLSNLTNLRELWATNCKIVDINILSNMKNLEWINLSHNNINEIQAFSCLPDIEYLYLDNNEIESLCGLENLKNISRLRLYSNKIRDIKPLFDNVYFKSGFSIDLSDNPLSEKTLTEYIPKLEERGVKIKKQ